MLVKGLHYMKSIQEFEISLDSAIVVWFVWVEFEHNWVGPCQFDWMPEPRNESVLPQFMTLNDLRTSMTAICGPFH